MDGSPTDSRDLRSRLLEAGNAVFGEVGYTGATVDDLIARASTSRATFYRYFHNKDDLFDELSRACFRDMRAIVDDLARMRAGEVDTAEIEQVLSQYRDLHARHAGVFRAWWERVARLDPEVPAEEGHVFNRLVESLTRFVSDARVESLVAPEVQAALLYLLVEGSYAAVTSRWSRIDPDALAPTLARMVHRTYLGGDVPRRASRLRLA
ncbi:MAG TPA: TetR/AcrR family transcriptional regulator [Acidimicrobiales bacterium]|nr:TetR/AcrR family transcriptional regulator [Acidimicrobiales bacterium]